MGTAVLILLGWAWDVTLFKSLGIGLEDIAVAARVFAKAKEAGVGAGVSTCRLLLGRGCCRDPSIDARDVLAAWRDRLSLATAARHRPPLR